MKNGEERGERTFPERVQVEEDRIHMDDSSSLSLSEEELIEREPSLQRTFRESDGYPSRPTVFFSNVQSVISTDAPSSIDTGASVELPNVHEVNVPVASVPLNCTREAVHSHIEEESMDKGRAAEKMQFVNVAFPFTAMMFPSVDACGMNELNEVSVSVSVRSGLTVTSGVVRLGEYVKLNVTAEKPLSPVIMKLLSSSAEFV